MKTTLNIPDDLMRDIKKKAADSGLTISEVLSQTLREGMSKTTPRKIRKLPSFNCGKIYVDISDREQLYRIMEGK